ncbi:MAG: NUDIX domain-containing protein [Candidatus Polarisedimenticolaceae bacterium]|nr:NUDIX domain-containing protein [Candidatus Polarisedimenticolaceae bacterium]
MKYEIEIQESSTGYHGFFKLNQYHLRHSLFQGGWGDVIVRERIEGLRTVGVLLYDPLLDQVVLIEQFRIGAMEAGKDAWLLEVVAGLVDKDESEEMLARRESLEEANCECLDLIPMYDFYVSPGSTSERLQLFCGRVDASNAGGCFGLADEGEDIRVVVMDVDSAISELYNGRANSASIIIGLQWLILHKDEIRQKWIETTAEDGSIFAK